MGSRQRRKWNENPGCATRQATTAVELSRRGTRKARYEIVGLKKQGTHTNIELSTKNCLHASSPRGPGGVADVKVDKSAIKVLRASERRYRLLFERNPAGICRTAISGRILDCNDSFACIFGYESRAEVLSAGAASLYFRPEHRRDLLAKLRENHLVNNLELRLKRKDGTPVWVLGNASLIEGIDGQLAVIEGIWIDITERKIAEEQLRALSAHLQMIREEERTTIAREIHDQLGQALTMLKMELSLLVAEIPKGSRTLHRKVASISKLFGSTLQAVREISTRLRPSILDHFGLTAAVQQEMSEFGDRTGVGCEFVGREDLNLDQDRSTALFRIFQEALTNVARHANATKVVTRLAKEGNCVRMVISDNGLGIQRDQVYNPRSLGLIGMRERAQQWGGSFHIRRINGSGTVIKVLMPIQ